MNAPGTGADPALVWAAERLGTPIAAIEPLTGGSTSRLRVLVDDTGRRTVLREITEEPWRTHGPELATRERRTLAALEATAVPAPATIALDATGVALPYATHLMSWLPGRADELRDDRLALDALAETLALIHAVRPVVVPRDYQSWAWPATFVVPAWARDPGPWRAAFAMLGDPAPAYEPVFLHRDFGPHNVLWGPVGARTSSLGALAGVVDWVETSWGPAWLDVAHCRTNLALRGGPAPARAFVAAYRRCTGREPCAYWDVMDVVGFLPRPGGGAFTDDPVRLARLDAHLRDVVSQGG